MKKLLSLVLVLAMLMSMSVVSVFATEETVHITESTLNLATGGEATLQVTTSPAAATLTWSSNAENVATVNTAGKVTALTTGSAVIKAQNAEVTEAYDTCTVTVYDSTLYSLTAGQASYSFKKGQSGASVSATLAYSGSNAEAAKTAAHVVYTKSGTVAVDSSNGNVTTSTVGKSTVTAQAYVGTKAVGNSVTMTVDVYDLAVDYEIANKGTKTVSLDTLKTAIASEIVSKTNTTNPTIDSVSLALATNGTYGSLYVDSSSTALSTTSTNVTTEIKYVAASGAIGVATYNFSAQVNGITTPFTGTLSFDIQPYDTIEDVVSAPFSSNKFYIYAPSDVDYFKVSTSSTEFSGVFAKGDSDMNTKYEFSPSGKTITNGKCTLYVVGVDDYGYVYTGTITVEDLDYDIKYVGAIDKATYMVGKDFEDLYSAIYDETLPSNSTAYADLEEVTFSYSSSNKNYKLYNDGSEMTTTSLKTVAVKDLDDVSVTPLKSGEYTINVTLKGKLYSSSSASKGTDKSYSAIVMISALDGDIEYSVVSKSSVYLDEDDFQDFYEDAVNNAGATLAYITLDTDDLKTTQGYVYVGTRTQYDDDKLYTAAEAGRSDIEIGETRFAPATTLANGAKVYIPFTAYGYKNATSKTISKGYSGYIEFTVINNPFTDLTQTWYKDAVLWAYGHNPQITKGTNVAGTLFSPDLGCTRAQAVTFLYRAAGAPSVTAAARTEVLSTFKDVDATKHKDYIDAIAWAKANGITSGTSKTTFGPDKTCTRAQIVTFIYNYAKAYSKDTTTKYTNIFTDVKPTTTHKSYAAAIQWAYENNITSGTSKTTFAPDATCTRGHIVTFLYNYFK